MDSPEALLFFEPVPLHPLDEEGQAVVEPLPEIRSGDRVCFEHPWKTGQERFLAGTVRGNPEDGFVLELGRSLGKLVRSGSGWACTGLVARAAVARGLLEELEG